MAGTIVVDTIRSDSSYASQVNVTSNVAFSAPVNFTGGMRVGGVDASFGGMRNRIINGDMQIDQRNAGAAWGTSINGYTVDRWQCLVSATGKLNGGQNYNSITPPAGFTNYIGVQSQSAYSVASSDYFFLQQIVEGYNVSDFGFGTANAQPITLSFWVRSSLTGTFGLGFTGYNGVSFRGYAATYTINSANTWEYKTVTIPGDTGGSGVWSTTTGIGLRVNFGLGVGSTYLASTGSWGSSNIVTATGSASVVGTNGATFYITGVQLEKGSSATSFEYLQYQQELALCQRYFWYGVATLYGFNYDGGNVPKGDHITFPVTMRVAPTMTMGSSITSSATNGPGAAYIQNNGFIYYANITGNATYVASNYFSASAEI